MSDDKKSHFVNFWNSTTYSPFSLRGTPQSEKKTRNPKKHGAMLKSQYTQSWSVFENQREEYAEQMEMDFSDGIVLTFQSSEDLTLQIDSLKSIRNKIELRAVKWVGNTQVASVFIPDSARKYFLEKIEKFIKNDKESGTGLYYVLEQIQAGTIKQLWTEPFPMPANKNEKFLWEVWLSKTDDDSGEAKLKQYCKRNNLFIHDSKVYFDDRTVFLVSASVNELEASIFVIPELSELRSASRINVDFISMQARERQEFIDDLKTRVSHNKSNILITLFDTGVKAEHDLIEPFLDKEHTKTVNNDWCLRDLQQHGTPMAGLAIYGNLVSPLEDSFEYEISHSIESVKIYNTKSNDPELIPSITQVAFDLTSDNDYKRVYVLSLTQGEFNFGMPTSQSAIIDKNTFGYDGNSKLMVVATGNRQESHGEVDLNYIDSADDYQLQEPSQSWNALVVGGYTELTSVSDPNYNGAQVLAPKGELSPSSRVSTRWDEKKWPIKPEIVMESGNCLSLNDEINSVDDLSLLSTSAKYDTQLESFNGTSAASAQAAKLCAEIMVKYPELRAETIKGLIIHTARWTEPMIERYLADTKKTALEKVLRTYGYGVPNLDRALFSLQNSVTLIIEDEIVPFTANSSNNSQKVNQWNVHDLPWPTELLEELGAVNVKLTVTLCYFVEPHASRRGFMKRYMYNSHGLKLEMKAPEESDEDFRIRVNKLEAVGAKKQSEGDGSEWLFGPTLRSHTTCQKDVWEGSAAKLAGKNQIGIYPVSGWWKSLGTKDRDKGLWESKAHYSLIVSLSTEDQDIDLYSAIKNEIEIRTDIAIKQDVDVDGS